MQHHWREAIILGILMGVVLSLCMSGIMTWLTLGFSPDFWTKWLQGFIVSFVISTPLAIVIIPPLRRLARIIAGWW